ncbi:hypothetical protein [Methylobacterium persicinum]|uniref:Uncharacterized protein n=1 Tax=Methylobacterium persicinum TaxID=374426 RepID=A0ABU0HTX4_9HYPH|nr:hypothetical protein [Methylobacterium persicinum]MDQ0445180.1 hypothetical protein [Methylobacterium persicinum]GJE39092.1 hypothetical protein KHHGKMAE_3171 [Methylobacterium persicinum]
MLRSETPPPPGNLEPREPPDSDRPNAAQLKGDIDSGRTGDKIAHTDVGAAMLGTCEEAGGAPPTPQEVKLARKNEAASERVRKASDPHGKRPWTLPLYAGVVAAICAVLVGGLMLLH